MQCVPTNSGPQAFPSPCFAPQIRDSGLKTAVLVGTSTNGNAGPGQRFHVIEGDGFGVHSESDTGMLRCPPRSLATLCEISLAANKPAFDFSQVAFS